MKTLTVGAGEFKTHCLHYLNEINHKRTELVITKHGKPVAKLVPVETTPTSLYGCLKDTVVIRGDIVSSAGESWDVESEDAE